MSSHMLMLCSAARISFAGCVVAPEADRGLQVYELLVQHGAEPEMLDDAGQSAAKLAPKDWELKAC